MNMLDLACSVKDFEWLMRQALCKFQSILYNLKKEENAIIEMETKNNNNNKKKARH